MRRVGAAAGYLLAAAWVMITAIGAFGLWMVSGDSEWGGWSETVPLVVIYVALTVLVVGLVRVLVRPRA